MLWAGRLALVLAGQAVAELTRWKREYILRFGFKLKDANLFSSLISGQVLGLVHGEEGGAGGELGGEGGVQKNIKKFKKKKIN